MDEEWWEAGEARKVPCAAEVAALRSLAGKGTWKVCEGYQRPPPGTPDLGPYKPRTGATWADGHVSKLELPANGLAGKFPARELGELRRCLALVLFGNSLSGSVDCARLSPTLVHLDLSDNAFEGPFPAVGCLFKLKRLHLDRNKFRGALPAAEFATLKQLQCLTAYQNRLSGPLPSFAGCASLEKLWLHDNPDLQGPVPDDLRTNCPHLTSLLLSFTRVQRAGPLPPHCDVQIRPVADDLPIDFSAGLLLDDDDGGNGDDDDRTAAQAG
mmetsp:Transcript_20718/g.64017  ORF Transcript_20718/g.64017 Transcript_20718/m.64017 type:complete len:270 (-) Transcript_20718:355-1164(-)